MFYQNERNKNYDIGGNYFSRKTFSDLFRNLWHVSLVYYLFKKFQLVRYWNCYFKVNLCIKECVKFKDTANFVKTLGVVSNLDILCKIRKTRFFEIILPKNKWKHLLVFTFTKDSHYEKSVKIWSFFWSVFSCVRTEFGFLLLKSPYSVRIQENTDQKKVRIGTIFTQC